LLPDAVQLCGAPCLSPLSIRKNPLHGFWSDAMDSNHSPRTEHSQWNEHTRLRVHSLPPILLPSPPLSLYARPCRPVADPPLPSLPVSGAPRRHRCLAAVRGVPPPRPRGVTPVCTQPPSLVRISQRHTPVIFLLSHLPYPVMQTTDLKQTSTPSPLAGGRGSSFVVHLWFNGSLCRGAAL